MAKLPKRKVKKGHAALTAVSFLCLEKYSIFLLMGEKLNRKRRASTRSLQRVFLVGKASVGQVAFPRHDIIHFLRYVFILLMNFLNFGF